MSLRQPNWNSVWRRSGSSCLASERVGTTTNFFDLGGHSLLLVQMQQYIGQQCGQHVALVDLLRFTTIKRLAEFLLAPDAAQGTTGDQTQLRAAKQRLAFWSHALGSHNRQSSLIPLNETRDKPEYRGKQHGRE